MNTVRTVQINSGEYGYFAELLAALKSGDFGNYPTWALYNLILRFEAAKDDE